MKRNILKASVVTVVLVFSPLMAQGKKVPVKEAKEPVPVSSTGTVAAPRAVVPLPPIESLIRSIGLPEAKQVFDSGAAVFVDGRPQVAFNIRHIKGAIDCSLGDFERQFAELKNKIQPDTQIVVYCSSATCGLADKIAQMLLERGMKDILVFRGGMAEWLDAGYPVE